jgi:hypothetical protein
MPPRKEHSCYLTILWEQETKFSLIFIWRFSSGTMLPRGGGFRHGG